MAAYNEACLTKVDDKPKEEEKEEPIPDKEIDEPVIEPVTEQEDKEINENETKDDE